MANVDGSEHEAIMVVLLVVVSVFAVVVGVGTLQDFVAVVVIIGGVGCGGGVCLPDGNIPTRQALAGLVPCGAPVACDLSCLTNLTTLLTNLQKSLHILNAVN